MSSKLLVIIASGDRDKALTGLMYAENALKRGWLEDVKVFFFGPVEKLMVEDEEVSEAVKEVAALGECIACKAISDENEISEKVENLGVRVEYVGSIISGYIREGYAPMVW